MFLIEKSLKLKTKKGKKHCAEKVFFKDAIELWKKKKLLLFDLLEKSAEKLKLYISLKKAKLRGASIQIPCFLTKKNRILTALKTLNKQNINRPKSKQPVNFFSQPHVYDSLNDKKCMKLQKNFYQQVIQNKQYIYLR